MSDYKRLEISAVTFECVSRTELRGVDRKTLERMLEICDSVKDQDFRTNTYQQLQNESGSDSVKTRSSRAALVCLVLLCCLLLTAVIVLCVFIYTNNTNYTRERNQLLINITNIKEERDDLLKKNGNLLNKIDQLEKELPKRNGWIYYQFSFYYMSNESKSWTESRHDCQQRGADMVIINNKEEQDFVMKITYKKEFWIGVTDSEEEGRWKGVDGSVLTSGFWASNEPNGKREENCAVTYQAKHPDLRGWIDLTCNDAFQWICEKSILPLTVP